jgi:CBS domain-containing protein
MKVRDLMKYPITTVRPEVSVLDAIKIMANEGKGCVLVAREGLLKECMGIVTTTQIFRRVFAAGLNPGSVKVTDIMTPAPLITIGLNATTKDAAALMISNGIRRLPVVENGTLVGIISSKDLLKCVE